MKNNVVSNICLHMVKINSEVFRTFILHKFFLSWFKMLGHSWSFFVKNLAATVRTLHAYVFHIKFDTFLA